jgi:glutamate racemase
MNCNLVILACNTASAKALRTIQQNNLPELDCLKKVLGVIRPTAEVVDKISSTGHVGIFATQGTVASGSYHIEISKLHPATVIYQEACPMWVPLVENDEYESEGADYFIKKHVTRLLSRSEKIDTILLACTHYPLLIEKIRKFVPEHIAVVPQGEIVAGSLVDYLKRHPEVDELCTRNGHRLFYTTDSVELFDGKASEFLKVKVYSEQITIP